MQVAQARFDQLRIDLHHLQDRLGANQQGTGNQADGDCQPQCLADQWTDFSMLPGTKALGYFRRGSKQNAGHEQEHRNPDRVAQRDGCKIARAHPTGHHRIDEAHGRGGQLRNDYRRCQQQ
ncbi:hypothetical protein D3C77_575020 [compost metagenome]